MKFDVLNRWSGRVQFTADIECDDGASVGLKLGLAVRWARNSRAVLRGAVLRGADLSDADLSGADLSDVPKIPDIHKAIYQAASQPNALDMGNWHSEGACGTTHCRAGWVVTLAGDAGKAMEFCMGTPAAAALIYLASDPTLERIPDFYCDNETALEDMRQLAGDHAAAAEGASPEGVTSE